MRNGAAGASIVDVVCFYCGTRVGVVSFDFDETGGFHVLTVQLFQRTSITVVKVTALLNASGSWALSLLRPPPVPCQLKKKNLLFIL